MPFLLFWFSFCASPDYFLRVCKSAHIRFFIRNLTISISRRADCVENPFASRHAPKRVSPSLARAEGAVGLMQC